MSPSNLPGRAWAALASPREPGGPLDRGIVEAAVQVALLAGELQRSRFRHLTEGSVRTKTSRRDLVTDVDVESERLIVQRLRALRPEWTVEAEEETSDATSSAPRWIIDPIDGTVNFVHGIPMFCVSIALCASDEPLLGIVHAPALQETFVAARGSGAFRFGPEGEAPVRLAVSEVSELEDAVLATGFPYRRGELENSNLENFGRFFYGVRGLRRMGSAALDLAFVAAGRLDGFWELHLSPYDVAAGALLVREAGGVVCDADGGQGWLRGGQIVAASGGLAPRIAERVHA